MSEKIYLLIRDHSGGAIAIGTALENEHGKIEAEYSDPHKNFEAGKYKAEAITQPEFESYEVMGVLPVLVREPPAGWLARKTLRLRRKFERRFMLRKKKEQPVVEDV